MNLKNIFFATFSVFLCVLIFLVLRGHRFRTQVIPDMPPESQLLRKENDKDEGLSKYFENTSRSNTSLFTNSVEKNEGIETCVINGNLVPEGTVVSGETCVGAIGL